MYSDGHAHGVADDMLPRLIDSMANGLEVRVPFLITAWLILFLLPGDKLNASIGNGFCKIPFGNTSCRTYRRPKKGFEVSFVKMVPQGNEIDHPDDCYRRNS